MRGPRRVLPWLALLTASGAVAQLPKAGHELQVNTYTTSKQEGAAVAMHADGAFVVVWGSSDQDGNKEGVFGQRFSSSGASQAVEFQVNAYTTGTTPTLGIQDQPQVAPDGDGGFIVVWRSFSQDGNSYGVFARRFDDAGAAVSGDFQVNSYVLAQQAAPAIASDGDGDFVVAWQSFGQDKSSYGIFARRFDSQGEGLGIEFQVNQHTSNAQYAPAVGIAPDDGFVIVWESSLQDGGAGPGVFAQRYDSSGAEIGSEFQVNTHVTGNQENAAVSVSPTGRIVIVWQSSGQDGSSNGVFAKRYDSIGVADGLEFQVNTLTLNNQYNPAIETYPDGDFVVTWSASSQDGSGFGVFAQRFTSAGARIGREFRVNTYTEGSQSAPAIAMDDDGNRVVIAWESGGQDSDDDGVFAQRFAGELAALDVDADGQFLPLFDAVLVVRHAFGFSGTTLTDGAVSPTCTRCGGAEISAYLNANPSMLDIDGDSIFRALTDGLLLLRYGLGFIDDALTSGAVGDDCDRCDADAITMHLDGLV